MATGRAKPARRPPRPPSRRTPVAAQPLLRAKLSRPNVGPLVLERPRLVQTLLEHADRPLTLLVADAGYGKTTLVAGFARALRRPVVWYSLVPSDAEPAVFGRYLLEGFRRDLPRFGRAFERALEEAGAGAKSAEVLGGTLANELSRRKGPPALLVLDDFHEVAGPSGVVTMLDTLVQNLPASCRLLVTSRSEPPLRLERMRARGEVFELHSGHLRFTREELGRLFSEVYQLPLEDDALTALEETTLGWPTAVRLVYEALRRSPGRTLAEVLAEFRASNLELHDYLSAEVYGRLEPELRDLLERIATLERFDAELAAALAGTRETRSRLEALAARGLVRSFGEGPHATYECHELVRRFVRDEIAERGGAQVLRRWEAEAGRELERRGLPEPALRHYLNAGREAEAAGLLRELAPHLLRQGRVTSLLQYVDRLPKATVQSDPSLAVAQADAKQTVGEWDEAERLYEGALERCRAAGEREWECRALLGLGKLLQLRGKHEQVLGMVERGLAMSEALPLEVRARLLQRKAGAHFYLGQSRVAVQILDQVRSLLADGADPELTVQTVHNLAIAYAAQGRLREASQEFRVALAHVRGAASPRAPLYLSNLALLLANLGDLAEARRAAEEGLSAARRFSNRAQETACLEALAQILAELGDEDGALAMLRQAEDLNSELRMEVLAADLLALRGRVFCARGQYRRAVEFFTQAIARLSERPDAPRLTEFRAVLAWCELRAGRPRVARDILRGVVARADAEENEFERMRVHYWLAEALLALDETRGVDSHLRFALERVRERGYLYFLRVQAREQAAPLLHALERGIEVDVAASALAEAGGAVEEALLELVPRAPEGAAEAAISVLGEVGGSASAERLPELGRAARALQPAIRTALRHVQERLHRAGTSPSAKSHRVRLVLFGPPHLEVDDGILPASAWRTQRALHVLLYLTLQPRGASREALVEMFWPGRQVAAGRRNFHPTLSYMRSVLPRLDEAPLLREGECYRLNPAYPMTCDVWDFEARLGEARRASPERRLEILEEAIGLAGAPLLEGVYGDWADAHQGKARDRLETVLLELGELCARAGDFERALRHFRRAVECDEFRETTRVFLIECLVRLGNRKAALVEYDRLKSLLRSELAVEPLPETDEAVRRLLAGGEVQNWPSPAQSGARKGPPRDPSESAQLRARQTVARVPQASLKDRAGDSSG